MGAHAERKGYTRAQREGGHLQVEETPQEKLHLLAP